MTGSSPQTVTHHERPSIGAPPERVPVALVGGSAPVVTDDLHRLLRRRLRFLCTLLAAAFAVTFAVQMLRGPDPDHPRVRTYRDLLLEGLPWHVLLAVNVAAAVLLSRRPPTTLFGLRLVEAAVVGPLVAVVLSTGVHPLAYEFLEAAPGETSRTGQAFIGRYTNAGLWLWLFVLTAYGTLIPNTLRRAALVLGGIAVSPLILFVIFAVWVKPLAPTVTAQVATQLAVGNGIALCLVLFATSRIEVLRRQATEARKLGQYVLKEKLGSGGMGEVYRAEHALLRRPCALKTIRPERAGDPDTLRRFEREVQTTATLTHPNTVQVFDYGHAEDGTFYYVMEFLPGLTLEELVRRHGPLPPGRAVHFLRQVCAALGEAHACGLTHRDVKPGNVMVCERGGVPDVAKVLDFGLVRMPKDAADGTLTREGTIAGTPAYMSPEQAGGEDGIDPRSDLYSVGAVAYFLLTGQPPFAGRSAAKMLAAHLYEPPAALPADVPPDLAAVVMRCLAKVPAERWPDAASLGAALAATTSVPAWTAGDATAWWAGVGSGGTDAPAIVTATWAEPGAAPDPAGM